MESEDLPICKYESEIFNCVRENDYSFIVGLPGSGKSTQIPKFLLSYDLEKQIKIAMTQPKKLAVYNIYSNLVRELGDDAIGFQTGDKLKTSSSMKIKIMSDGIFLKEMQNDLSLLSYDYVLIDEAQLRKKNSDIISLLMINIVNYRKSINKPLKIVFLSSTTDIINIFKLFIDSRSIGIVNVEGRRFITKNHFCKIDPSDYHSKSAKFIKNIHLKLPRGNILTFVPGINDIDKIIVLIENARLNNLRLIPLHSKISYHSFKSSLLFDGTGERICYISTNVAETSLTLPAIKYVIDCGKVKKKMYEASSGSFSYEVTWESKESAKQRAGRTGRTEPGHCYYLFTSETYFKNLPEFDDPEISQTPLEESILLLKSFGLSNYQYLLRKLWHFEDLHFSHSLKNLRLLSLLTPKDELTDTGLYCSALPLSFQSNFFIACFVHEVEELIYCAVLFSFCLEKFPELWDPSCFKRSFKSDVLSILYCIFSNFDSYFSCPLLEELSLVLKKCNRVLSTNMTICKTFPLTSKSLLDKFCMCIILRFRKNLAAKVKGTEYYETSKNGNTIVCKISKHSSFSKSPPSHLIYLSMGKKGENYFIEYLTLLEID